MYEAFCLFDTDGSGEIDKEEFIGACQELKIPQTGEGGKISSLFFKTKTCHIYQLSFPRTYFRIFRSTSRWFNFKRGCSMPVWADFRHNVGFYVV